MHSLINGLTRQQGRAGLTDRQLARRLRVDRSTLLYVKTGAREPGLKVLRGILHTFPSLEPLVLDFIRNGDGDGAPAP